MQVLFGPTKKRRKHFRELIQSSEHVRKKAVTQIKVFRANFVQHTFHPNLLWGIAQLSRVSLQNGVSHGCACVKLSREGGIAPTRPSSDTFHIARDTCSNRIANSLVLVFMGYRTTIVRYIAKRGIAQMCPCETKYQGGGGYRTILGECQPPCEGIA